MAAAVSYLTLVPGAVVLFLPHYRNSRFVRFHAWQSVLLWGTFFLASGLAILLSSLAAPVVFLLIGVLACLAMFFLWAVLSFKAWQGELFQLPVFGDFARRLESLRD
jgi:uncharacterized membrane protein